MTSRERIEALCVRLENDAETCLGLADKLLAKAVKSEIAASRLRAVAKNLTDKQCDKVVEDWKDEEKPS